MPRTGFTQAIKRIIKPKCLIYALTCFLCLLSTHTFGKSEQDIKAAYLYNFIKFVEWPDDKNHGDHALCIVGKDSLNEKLRKLDQRSLKNKTLSVFEFEDIKLTANVDCRILFIGQSERKFLDDILNIYADKPTLTISSIEEFAEQGGMIGFIKLGNIVRFNINLYRANSASVSIRAKLLELANKVVQ